ncbi:MAG: hypothetical protein ACYTDY_15975 [Planctomycetota bacterium]|jgi:hypothetical protein
MLSPKEKEALRRWYSREKVLEEARRLIETEYWQELEELLHMRGLFPLSRHSQLPDFMKDEEGKPIFPTNLNPARDLEKWQEAIEVGWEVLAEECGITHDDIHLKIAGEQQKDWQAFLDSVEERRKRRKD